MYEVLIELERSGHISWRSLQILTIIPSPSIKTIMYGLRFCKDQHAGTTRKACSYPHGVTIDAELAHSLLGQSQLLLQISSRAPGIVEIQLRILQLLCESRIFKAQTGFHALAVNQKVLEKSRRCPQRLEQRSLDLPLLTHCQCLAATAELETAGRNP